MTLEKEIYREIAGCCISDESAKYATEKIMQLFHLDDPDIKIIREQKIRDAIRKELQQYNSFVQVAGDLDEATDDMLKVVLETLNEQILIEKINPPLVNPKAIKNEN
jgi:hypothetical protein